MVQEKQIFLMVGFPLFYNETSSNVFLHLAIQFVLADEHLTKKERQKILHTTTGIRTPCASVEIVFNNELQRMAVCN